MDFKKIINAAKFPTILIIVLEAMWALVYFLLVKFPSLWLMIIVILGGGLFAIQCFVTAWAGYSAVKKQQLDLLGATLTGALASMTSTVIVNVIASVIGIVMLLVAYLAPLTTHNPPRTTVGGILGGIFNVISLIIVLAISVIWWGGISLVGGLVLGAIGGFIAEMRTKAKKLN
jgi:hypothetical protein